MLLIKSKSLRLLFGTLETANFLYLKLMLKDPARARRYAGKVFRTYMSLASYDKWSCKGIDEIFPDLKDRRIVLEHLLGKGIYNPIDELAYLAISTRAVQPRNIFEIGTFRGRTALIFALNSPADCRVYTMDLPPDDRSVAEGSMHTDDVSVVSMSRPGADYQGKDVASKITQLYGDSTKFDFSPYYGKMDMVFIDGAHHYEAVVVDTKNALKMVRPGGYILWHDFATYGDYNDVTRAVLDILPSREVIQIDNTLLAIYQHKAGNATPK